MFWLFVGAEAPETWAIVERRASGGGAGPRGLVPESYVGPDKDGEAQERAQALAHRHVPHQRLVVRPRDLLGHRRLERVDGRAEVGMCGGHRSFQRRPQAEVRDLGVAGVPEEQEHE